MYKLTWENPTLNTDGSAYDHKAQGSGYELYIDSDALVSLPFAFGTEFSLRDLAGFDALKPGSHTVGLRVVTRAGERSAYAELTFQKVPVPLAPRALAVV